MIILSKLKLLFKDNSGYHFRKNVNELTSYSDAGFFP